MPLTGGILTVKEIQALDKKAICSLRIPSLDLMENAGRAVAQEALGRLKNYCKPSVIIFCGQGNNGGDGLVAARYLNGFGVKAVSYIIGKATSLKQDAAVNFDLLKCFGYPFVEAIMLEKDLRQDIKKASLFVDAIFGVGLNRSVQEPFRSFIEAINQEKKEVVSIDIPSGLDGTTGKVYGVCVQASVTVTFSFPKTGFYKNHGPRMTGDVVTADIGIPRGLLKRIRP